jgi:hypothetical protein
MAETTPFCMEERFVGRVWLREKEKSRQNCEEIKENFVLCRCFCKTRRSNTIVNGKSFAEIEIPATTCHVTLA